MRRALLVAAASLALVAVQAEPADAQSRRSVFGSGNGSQGVFKRPRWRLFGNRGRTYYRPPSSNYRPTGGGGG